MKPRSKFISEIYFLFNTKLNGQKLGCNIPLRSASLNSEFTGSYKKSI